VTKERIVFQAIGKCFAEPLGCAFTVDRMPGAWTISVDTPEGITGELEIPDSTVDAARRAWPVRALGNADMLEGKVRELAERVGRA
jgi:hypothetical protein